MPPALVAADRPFRLDLIHVQAGLAHHQWG